MTTLADYNGPIPLDHPMVVSYGKLLSMVLRIAELEEALQKALSEKQP